MISVELAAKNQMLQSIERQVCPSDIDRDQVQHLKGSLFIALISKAMQERSTCYVKPST